MARKPQGAYLRKDGRYEKRIVIDGKRYSVYGKTSKELTEKEIELREQIRAGMYTENKNITLDKYFPQWIEGKKATVKSNTIYIYTRNYNNYISPVLGKKKIQKLERRELLEFQSGLSKRLAPKTVNLIIVTLKTILADCVRDEIITKSPVEFVKNLKEDRRKAVETYHRALTEQEQKDFMEEAKEEYYYTFLALLLCTGMRTGEAAALTWSDIDYINNVIHVSKTTTKDEKGAVIIRKETKSTAGKRDIPMTETIKINKDDT